MYHWSADLRIRQLTLQQKPVQLHQASTADDYRRQSITADQVGTTGVYTPQKDDITTGLDPRLAAASGLRHTPQSLQKLSCREHTPSTSPARSLSKSNSFTGSVDGQAIAMSRPSEKKSRFVNKHDAQLQYPQCVYKMCSGPDNELRNTKPSEEGTPDVCRQTAQGYPFENCQSSRLAVIDIRMPTLNHAESDDVNNVDECSFEKRRPASFNSLLSINTSAGNRHDTHS